MTLNRASARLAVFLLVLLALFVAQSWGAGPARAAGTIVYDSIPDVPPMSYPSIGYQATQTAEFGDLVEVAGTDRDLETVTVGLVSWACESGSWVAACSTTTPGASYDHDITITLYEEGTPPAPGAVIATLTKTVAVPFRPTADPTCPSATQWRDPVSQSCQNGFLFLETFDLTSLVVALPDRFIVSVAFNTQTYGAAPTGVDGPYNSLNVAVVSALPTVGTDVDPDAMYWNGGVPASGLLADTGWQTPSPQFGLALEIVAGDLLSTLPDPTTPPTVPADLPTLAETGSEPSPVAGIAALAALLIGTVLVAVAPRRPRAHRA